MAKLTIFRDGEKKCRWFKFDDDTEVEINYLDRQELRKINTKADKACRMSQSDVGADYANCLLGRAAVNRWRKVDDHNHPGLIVDGQPLPYNQDNLDMLMTKSLDFSRFVNGICIDAEMFDVEDEAAAKNG